MTVERVSISAEDMQPNPQAGNQNGTQGNPQAPQGTTANAPSPNTQNGTNVPSQGNQRPQGVPEFVPEKFWNSPDPIKAMAESYTELEKKQGGQPPTPNPETPTPENLQAQLEAAPKELQSAVAKAQNEYSSNGKLSDETYKSLESLGIPSAIVKQYEVAAQVIEQQVTQTMYEAAGGEERFNDILKWAGANLPADQVNALNTVFQNSNDPAEIKAVVTGLAGQYGQANGYEPTSRIGGSTHASTGSVFQSEYEVVQAMSDPRYGKDKGYTKEVEAKLAHSHEVFTNFRNY